MKITHLLTAAALAGGSVVVAAAPAQAHLLDVVLVEDAAPCPATYYEIAQLDQLTICYHLEVPEWKLVTDGAPCNTYGDTGWTEYSVRNQVRLCVRP